MPRSLNSSLMKPLVVLALPGMYLAYKINEYKRQKQEQNKRKVAERELAHLNHKIDKLLVKLEEHEPEMATSRDDECVICISAKATMQTFPCGHKVVCRKCFVRTIQMAVSQRVLPLRCVICRAKILRLKQSAPGNLHQFPSYAIYKNGPPISTVLQDTKDLPSAMLEMCTEQPVPAAPTKFCRQKLWNNKVADMPPPPVVPDVSCRKPRQHNVAPPAYVHQRRRHNRQPINKPSALLPIPESEEVEGFERDAQQKLQPALKGGNQSRTQKRTKTGAFSYLQQIRTSSPLKALRRKCK